MHVVVIPVTNNNNERCTVVYIRLLVRHAQITRNVLE